MAVDARALLRRAIGFAVGFGVALVIVVATQLSRDAREPSTTVLGTLDVSEYCRSGEFELEAVLRSDDAMGWRCEGRRNGILGVDPVDFDHACQQQFGAAATAVSVDHDSPYALQCVATD